MAQTKREAYERKRAHLRELMEAREVSKDDGEEILKWCDG